MILFLCRRRDLAREALGYARAFERRGVRVACVEDSLPCNGELGSLLARYDQKPALILHPETQFPFFPRGLTQTDIPTACFHYDVYAYTQRRVRWAMLFDYAFLFHPGFEEPFRSAGHPNPITLPHAVEQAFSANVPKSQRSIDLAWAGRIDGPLYAGRRRILPAVAASCRMNDWARSYGYEEMGKLYGCAKIGLNIARDDYPQDANLRVFEIMAAGAMLITSLPSELEKLGFRPGEHFVGYNGESNLLDSVRYYLAHDAERELMAQAGRELVLKEHTYDRRAEMIVQTLERDEGRLFAPARSWPEALLRQVYVDYYCANNLMACAFEEFRRLAVTRPGAACGSLPPILGAVRRRLKGRVTHFSNTWVQK